MILVGNQRGGAADLAAHLLKDENEHVSVHELRGFTSNDLHGALAEAEAISKGTRCRQFLFSMSFNPPANEAVKIESFETAINEAERRLGLSGQPRAVVFHEKEGRRHAHAVWSRIKIDEMKAVQLSFTKTKMQDLSRDLYREHGWKMPEGLAAKSKRDPRNFSLEEWQECKRRGVDPRAIKGAVQDAWSISDSPAALTHALRERGLVLAKGDRRSAVVLDHNGKPYSLATYAGVKAREVKARLGDTALPSMLEAQHRIASGMIPALNRMRREVDARDESAKAEQERKRQALVSQQREQRARQTKLMEERRWQEARERQARFRPGLGGLWDRLRGEYLRIKLENERAAYTAMIRDREQTDALILRHLGERRALDADRKRQQQAAIQKREELAADRARYKTMERPSPKPAFEAARKAPLRTESSVTQAKPKPEPTRPKTANRQEAPSRDDRTERLRALRQRTLKPHDRQRTRPGPDHSR
ncbi:MAG: relaxase/mobilization nuclease domain-containing protein [Pseudomonadota bacterium]